MSVSSWSLIIILSESWMKNGTYTIPFRTGFKWKREKARTIMAIKAFIRSFFLQRTVELHSYTYVHTRWDIVKNFFYSLPDCSLSFFHFPHFGAYFAVVVRVYRYERNDGTFCTCLILHAHIKRYMNIRSLGNFLAEMSTGILLREMKQTNLSEGESWRAMTQR